MLWDFSRLEQEASEVRERCEEADRTHDDWADQILRLEQTRCGDLLSSLTWLFPSYLLTTHRLSVRDVQESSGR